MCCWLTDLLCCFEEFDSFIFSALLQTQQAVLQQGIRNQVVVILNLSLTADNVRTQWLQYVWRWRPYEQIFLSTAVLFLFQNRTAFIHRMMHSEYDQANWWWHAARNWNISVFLAWLPTDTLHRVKLTCRGQGWSSVQPPLDAPGVWDTVLSRGSADTDRLWRTQSLANTQQDS